MAISDLGSFTITNLKSATGISDNRLSAHSRDGAGSNVSFGEFIIGALGRFNASDVWVKDLERVGSGQLSFGDTFQVIVEVGDENELEGAAHAEALDQILDRSANWTDDTNVTNGCSIDSFEADLTNDRILVNCTVGANDGSLDVGVSFDDGMHNTNVTHLGETLTFATSNVEETTPRISEVALTITDNSDAFGSSYDVEATPTLYDPASELSGSPYYCYYNETSQGTICDTDHPGSALEEEAGPSTYTYTNIDEFESGQEVTLTIVLTDGSPQSNDSNVKDILTFTVDLDSYTYDSNDEATDTIFNSAADLTFPC
jgi:hypothetical protein